MSYASSLVIPATTIDPEVFEAIKTAKMVSITGTTVDISFPYRFSDGNTWASITGFSINGTTAQGFTGLTTGNIYWLGIYIDLTASYSSTTAPVAGNVDIRLSNANTAEPTQAVNFFRIGTYLRVTASSATTGNLYAIISSQGHMCILQQDASQFTISCPDRISMAASPDINTMVGVSIANKIPPNTQRFDLWYELVPGSVFFPGQNIAGSTPPGQYINRGTTGAGIYPRIPIFCKDIPQEFRYASTDNYSFTVMAYTEV